MLRGPCVRHHEYHERDNDNDDEKKKTMLIMKMMMKTMTCQPSWSLRPIVSRSLLRRASSIAENKDDHRHDHGNFDVDEEDDEDDQVVHLPLGLLLLVPAGDQLAQLLQVSRVVQLNLSSPSEDVLKLNELALLRLQPGVEAPQLVVQLQSHVCKRMA